MMAIYEGILNKIARGPRLPLQAGRRADRKTALVKSWLSSA